MTTTSEELVARLEQWIPRELYQVIATDTTLIQEKQTDGRAEIVCSLPTGQTIELLLEGQHFPTLSKQNCADGILLIRRPDEEWELHIIECKRTVDKNKWARVKRQFLGAIQRALAILAPVGIQVSQIKLYTAYRDDELENDINARMSVAKLSSDPSHRPPYMDWIDERLSLWVKTDLLHEKIELDTDGNGQVSLHCM